MAADGAGGAARFRNETAVYRNGTDTGPMRKVGYRRGRWAIDEEGGLPTRKVGYRRW
jgi:hypothetical protein